MENNTIERLIRLFNIYEVPGTVSQSHNGDKKRHSGNFLELRQELVEADLSH